ncbi:MAG: AarF/ABC1/UbiB kinase family protein [Anaerolineae bacterium]|nr:AarF/ABC1/UbiB kinase family protein [Anaerolineae bacterium]
MFPLFRTHSHLGRYREIVGILVKHGVDELFERVGAKGLLPFPRRIYPQPGVKIGAPQRLRMALEELGPTFIKFGQILSTRPDLLPPAYIRELAKLQDTVPPAPWDKIQCFLEKEFRAPLERVFASFESEPIAAASLAQVHRATLRSGEKVVVKVQRPGIEGVIEKDLEILNELAYLARQTPIKEVYDPLEIVEEFSFTLRNELNYIREGLNAERFRDNFRHEPFLYIPKIYWDYTTRRVLVMEELEGIKIDDIEAIDAAGIDRHAVALNAARIIIKEVLVDGFFHADPHPGNFFVMEGGVIGAMDFGMVGHLTRRDKEDLIRLYIFAVRMDAEGVVEQLITMGAASPGVDRIKLARDISRLLGKYFGIPLKYIRATELMEDVTPLTFRYRLRFPSRFWLLGKTLAMMEGVGLKLDPDFDIFAVSEPYVRQFMLQMFSPRTLGEKLFREFIFWGEFLEALPRRIPAFLEQAEKGDLRLNVGIKEAGELGRRFRESTNRLALSILLAAFIISSAVVMAAWPQISQARWGIWFLAFTFALSAFLGVWLFFSILLGMRR